MSDVGFDSQKHDQTRHDAEQGGEHLGNAAKAAEAFAQAQTASVWGKEPGVEAARLALQAAYTGAGEGFAAERTRFTDFGAKVDQTEADFTRTEEAAAGQLASAGAAMNSNAAIANAAAGAGSAGSTGTAPSGVPSAVGDQPEL